MSPLEAIKARHAVRQYLETPIEAEKTDKINDCITQCNREGGVHLQMVTNDPSAFSSGLAKYGKFIGVSNYIAVVATKGNDGDEKAGYYGEKVVLLMQTLGLNSCWVGLTFKNNKNAYQVTDGEELKCVIAFGYGATQGMPHPQKKSLSDLSQVEGEMPEWFRRGIESAMLAPTALNQQKFLFRLIDGNKVEATTRFALNHYAHIDLGIAKLHFEIGAGKENFDWA